MRQGFRDLEEQVWLKVRRKVSGTLMNRAWDQWMEHVCTHIRDRVRDEIS